jgi:hypothetical protein
MPKADAVGLVSFIFIGMFGGSLLAFSKKLVNYAVIVICGL